MNRLVFSGCSKCAAFAFEKILWDILSDGFGCHTSAAVMNPETYKFIRVRKTLEYSESKIIRKFSADVTITERQTVHQNLFQLSISPGANAHIDDHMFNDLPCKTFTVCFPNASN